MLTTRLHSSPPNPDGILATNEMSAAGIPIEDRSAALAQTRAQLAATQKQLAQTRGRLRRADHAVMTLFRHLDGAAAPAEQQ